MLIGIAESSNEVSSISGWAKKDLWVLQRSPIPQTSNWSGTFFVVSYSKPALMNIM